ncbi:MAG: NAD(+) synthase [Candidatus Saganbacteria bacterium]|nr:NAD(+) synthase [Candidatus Saganbacteria bacterium]
MKQKIIDWLKTRIEEAGARGCVFGLSGGLDSAVVGILCKAAFPDNVLGLLMPCHSIESDIKHAQELAEKYSIPTKLIDLTPVQNEFYVQLEGKKYDSKAISLASANLRPRLRMISLYYHANKLNYLVVGTGNRSEAVMGYFTKYGDGGVDLLPLGSLLKSQVRQLAEELGVPRSIIDKAPSAGLWHGQTDEQEMGITYEVLDKIIAGLDSGQTKGLDARLVKKVQSKLAATEHKRSLPPVFKP